MIQPTPADVLLGRGASFNRHPGNEIFRKMLDEQKVIYSKSAKVRKVAISKSIVEAIYSKEPPGRFLKKCAKTGKWEELSKNEAYNKAAQAMAYAVRDMEKRGQSHAVPSQITLVRRTGEESEQIANQAADNSTDPSLQLQRLLLQPQQLSTASLHTSHQPTHEMPVASLNGLAQLLYSEQQQQTRQQQQWQLPLSLMGSGLLQPQPQPQHAFASIPSNLSQMTNPSLSVQSEMALLNDILRQASSSSLQGSIANLLGMQSISSRPDLPSLTRGIPQNQTGMLSVNQLQHRLDALLQNQLLSSLAQNQWLLQQPSRPLDLLQQALPSLLQSNSLQNPTNARPLLSQMVTSSSLHSSSTRQDEGKEEEKESESERSVGDR